MMSKRVLHVVAAIIERQGLVLACRRRPEKASGGKWEFPGGKMEPGETEDQALVREIREELGVAIEVIAPFRTDETDIEGLTIRLACFRTRLVADAPTHSSDHDELRWVTPGDIGKLEWAVPDLPAVTTLARGEF